MRKLLRDPVWVFGVLTGGLIVFVVMSFLALIRAHP